jgi:hypothetical protein
MIHAAILDQIQAEIAESSLQKASIGTKPKPRCVLRNAAADEVLLFLAADSAADCGQRSDLDAHFFDSSVRYHKHLNLLMISGRTINR